MDLRGNCSEMKISAKALSKNVLGMCKDNTPLPLSRLQVFQILTCIFSLPERELVFELLFIRFHG